MPSTTLSYMVKKYSMHEEFNKAVYEKFKQNSEILEILLNTGNEELIEATTDDYYWGCGKDGNGKNMLGKILMETREMFK